MDTFDIGRTISRTFKLAFSTFASVGLFILILQLASIGIQAISQSMLMEEIGVAQAAGDPDAALAIFRSGWYWAILIVSLVVGTLTFAGATDGYLKAARDEPVSLGDCFSAGLAKLLPVLGLTILWFLGVGLGWILLIVPGVILITMWSVAVPALVGEDRGIIASFGRSRELTRGSRLKIFLTLLIFLFLVYLIMFLLVGAILGTAMIGPEMMMTGTSIGALLLMVPVQWLFAAILTALLVSLYIETVTIKEGGSTEQLAEVFQ